MTTERWPELLVGRAVDADDAAVAVLLLAPAVHRLAWLGEDPNGDRRRALGWFRAAVAVLSETRSGLAVILDWWLVAALDEAAVQLAWSVDREVGPPTGDALRRILGSSGGRRLDAVRRPVLFERVLQQLGTASDRNPGKIAGDKAILTEVIGECKTVLRAAREGRPAPTELRLARFDDAEIESWASVGSAGRRVEPGTPVWDSLVKQIRHRAELVREALRLWPTGEETITALPPGWADDVAAVAGDRAELACALVADALPEPGPRPTLDPERVMDALGSAPGDPSVRSRAFALVREAGEAGGVPVPKWALAVEERVRDLTEEIERRTSEFHGSAAEALDAARVQLANLDLQGAADWLAEAGAEHERETAGADRDRRRGKVRERARQLESLGYVLPEEQDASWPAVVDERWEEVVGSMQELVHVLGEDRRLVLPTRALDEALSAVDRAIGRGNLVVADEALTDAQRLAASLHEAEERRIGPELAAIRTRSRGHALEPGVVTGVLRAAARREAGLPWEGLADELSGLLDRWEQSDAEVASLAVDVAGRSRPRRIAWVAAGIPSDTDELRSPVGSAHGVRITGGYPGDPVRRVSDWAVVHREAPVERSSPQTGPRPAVFLLDGEHVVGPYRLEGGARVPAHPWVAVAALPTETFEALFGRIDLPDGRWLVPYPPTLEELLRVGAELRDCLDAESAARHLAPRIDGAPAPETLAAWIRLVEEEPEPLRKVRRERVAALWAEAAAFADGRAEAVTRWLASPAGREAIDRASEALVSRETDRVEREVAHRRAELETELGGLSVEIGEVRARAASEEQRLAEHLDRVREDLAAADALLGDRKLRLLAELSGTRAAPDAAPAPIVTPIRATRFEPTDPGDVRTLIRLLAGHTWDTVDVANLVLSLATGRWTLVAGLPGVGKSTFVRSVLSRLGHGPGTERYLELVVRRDWQDDAALFGFWHPTDRAWMPSSEGFVEHLLRAADDERLGHGGIWPVLIEELNLASPEYYLARPISAFEAADPTVRLYDPELAPTNRDRYPPAFRVPGSVRLVATVNVDDTVERLSPRFLSRASVLWVEPRNDAPLWRPEDDRMDHRVRWSALSALGERGSGERGSGEGGTGELGRIGELVTFLQDARVPGAPTARTRNAIVRYLGASRDLLDRTVAEDFQVLQRVLPPLRGVGTGWRTLLDRLVALLQKNGWDRSAARASELRIRGEELGDWYDFFHT